MSADGIIILLIIALLVGVPLAAVWGKTQGQKHPLPPPHHHDFEKWEDCKLLQRVTWDGIAIGQPRERNGQTRACKSCGLRENRI